MVPTLPARSARWKLTIPVLALGFGSAHKDVEKAAESESGGAASVARDRRLCALCRQSGDRPDVEGRLLPVHALFEPCRWVHALCVLWSGDVRDVLHEAPSAATFSAGAGAGAGVPTGELRAVLSAIRRSQKTLCSTCGGLGASVVCGGSTSHVIGEPGRCSHVYHFVCALATNCAFLLDGSVRCSAHKFQADATRTCACTSACACVRALPLADSALRLSAGPGACCWLLLLQEWWSLIQRCGICERRCITRRNCRPSGQATRPTSTVSFRSIRRHRQRRQPWPQRPRSKPRRPSPPSVVQCTLQQSAPCASTAKRPVQRPPSTALIARCCAHRLRRRRVHRQRQWPQRSAWPSRGRSRAARRATSCPTCHCGRDHPRSVRRCARHRNGAADGWPRPIHAPPAAVPADWRAPRPAIGHYRHDVCHRLACSPYSQPSERSCPNAVSFAADLLAAAFQLRQFAVSSSDTCPIVCIGRMCPSTGIRPARSASYTHVRSSTPNTTTAALQPRLRLRPRHRHRHRHRQLLPHRLRWTHRTVSRSMRRPQPQPKSNPLWPMARAATAAKLSVAVQRVAVRSSASAPQMIRTIPLWPTLLLRRGRSSSHGASATTTTAAPTAAAVEPSGGVTAAAVTGLLDALQPVS